jgi:hypothetical protein
MRGFGRAFLIILAAACIVGCAPMVTVENKSDTPVRVVLSGPNGRQILSPAPGNTTAGEVAVGEWRVTVIPDDEWREYALDTRDDLVERLKNPDDLSRAEVAETLDRIKEVSEQLEQFERAASDESPSCSGTMAQEEMTASATITQNDDGSFEVVCVAGQPITEIRHTPRGR